MNVESLVLVEEDTDAQRLCVTWPKVAHLFPDHEDRYEQWASISGVFEDDIRRLEPMLFGNDFLGPEGMVDPQLLGFVRARLRKMLPKVNQT